MTTMTAPAAESLLDARIYAKIRPRLLREMVPVAKHEAVPHLIRETQDGKATGRWMVLEACRGTACGRFWAWPPVASNNSPNDAAARNT